MAKKIIVYIEKSEDGEYWGTTQNMEGVVSSFGETLEELKANIKEAIDDHLEVAEELGEEWAKQYNDYTLEFQLDLQGFFDLIPEVKIGSLAKKAGINASLLRQYKIGAAKASVEQIQKIESAVHSLGAELLSVSF